jgi:protein-tyrosine kinase
MSRVDEALRRAGKRDQDVQALSTPDAFGVEEPRDLAGERDLHFPLEMPRRVAAPAASAAPAAGPAIAPAQPLGVVTAPAADGERSSGPSLLRRLDASAGEKVIVDDRIMPASREQYRRLAAVLHDAQAERGLAVVMIASAVAAEGKTLTACNLALTLSESYRRRVLLIDADLRRPAIHTFFRLDAATGLSDGLTANEGARLLVRQVTPRLSVLPAGRPSLDPMAGLTSPRMHRLVAEARDAFDWVILDTPPLVDLPDAHLLAPIADGVVLVIQADSTKHELVARSIEAVGRQRVLGVVLNGAHDMPRGSYHDYYAHQAPADAPMARTDR